MTKLYDLIHSGLGNVTLNVTVDDLMTFAKEIITQMKQQESAAAETIDDELWTREKVMQYLDIKSTTLWQWGKMNILTPVKVNRKSFYRKSDILALQSANAS